MKISPAFVSSLAAAGLMAAPVSAQSAATRAASNVSENEELAGVSALLYLAALAAAAFMILVVADEDSFDDVDDLPASP